MKAFFKVIAQDTVVLILMALVGAVALSGRAHAANAPPVISGNPPTTIEQGARYSFTPTVVDIDGPRRFFVIKNRPKWLSFSYGTGGLSGIAPAPGVFKDIQIFVDDGPNTARSLRKFTIRVTAPAANKAPIITGAAVTSTTAGKPYAFAPTASDPDSDPLSFTIANKPAWANFDATSGKLYGTPSAADVGAYSNIVVGVTDGKASVSLPAFTLNVKQIQIGTATLRWQAPTQNVDGSALTDLAGYRIYYGTSANALNVFVQVPNAAITTYMVENLTVGAWYFAVKAYNAGGAESALSNIASKTIS